MKESRESVEARIQRNVEGVERGSEYIAWRAAQGRALGTRALDGYALSELKALGKPASELDAGDILRLDAEMSSRLSGSAVAVRRALIRQYLRWLHGLPRGEDADCVKPWIGSKSPVKVLPKGIMTPGQVKKLLGVCERQRDRAFFFCLFESGARIGEFLALDVGDIRRQDGHVLLRLSGKTGSRDVPLYDSAPDLESWLESHPDGSSPDSPLWLSTRGNRLHYNTVRGLLEKLAVRYHRVHGEHLPRDLTLHSFRHSRATELAGDLTEAQLRIIFGWTPSSDMPSVYVHLSGRDIISSMDVFHGRAEPRRRDDALGTVNCPRCGYVASGGSAYCPRCGEGLVEGSRKRQSDVMAMFRMLKRRVEELEEGRSR